LLFQSIDETMMSADYIRQRSVSRSIHP